MYVPVCDLEIKQITTANGYSFKIFEQNMKVQQVFFKPPYINIPLLYERQTWIC